MQFINKKGFSLMEIVVVIFIISIVVGFGLPQYTKALDKTSEKSAMQQLMALQAANFTYFSQAGEFLDHLDYGATPLDASTINSALNINIIPNGFVYSYSRSAVDAFTATATWGGSSPYIVQVDQTPTKSQILPATPGNPCCSTSGPSCPSLLDC